MGKETMKMGRGVNRRGGKGWEKVKKRESEGGKGRLV